MRMRKEDVIQYIKDNEDKALKKASQILHKETNMQSFNGIIGGKNATYDVNVLEYETPEDYLEAWMQSHQKKYNDERNIPYTKSSHRVHDMLQDSFLAEFIRNYLARTYFKKHD